MVHLVYLFYGFCWNANWWSGMIRFSSSIWRNLLSRVFSKILLIIGSRLIGLYELASSSSLPGFRIIMICTTFRWTGKYPVLIIELHVVECFSLPVIEAAYMYCRTRAAKCYLNWMCQMLYLWMQPLLSDLWSRISDFFVSQVICCFLFKCC
jgi:hypothetical protein